MVWACVFLGIVIAICLADKVLLIPQNVINLTWGYLAGPPIQYDWCPYEKRKRYQGHLERKKAMWGYLQKAPIYKPKHRLQENPNLPTLWCLTSRLRDCEKYISVIAATQSMIFCYGSPRKLIQHTFQLVSLLFPWVNFWWHVTYLCYTENMRPQMVWWAFLSL